jgi:hypothetical protein
MLLVPAAASARRPGPAVRLQRCQTVRHVGAAQGVEVRDGFIYIYGDAKTGVILQYRKAGSKRRPRLKYTGVQIRLTKNGENIIPHPTGLTHRPGLGTFIGNTVAGKGTIYKIDWQRALKDRTLDNAVQARIEDTAARNGTRPEFVKWGGKWLLATSDYGDRGNEVRLYDPLKLAAARTSQDPGVVQARFPAGPWVQSLHWVPGGKRGGKLALVQNQVAGLRWRLTLGERDRDGKLRLRPPLDLAPRDELEGFSMIDSKSCVLVSSSSRRNVWLGSLRDR